MNRLFPLKILDWDYKFRYDKGIASNYLSRIIYGYMSLFVLGTKQCEKKCFNVSYVMQIEYMEEEVLDLQQILSDKKQQEKAMLEV